MWNPIPAARFDAFHSEFHGDTWDLCRTCGGRCEINKIGPLMPGESDYIAARMGLDIGTFKREFLDAVETPYGVVQVLKMKPECPCIDSEFKCTIREFKAVLCSTYPIVFEVKGGKVLFDLDPWCAIVSGKPETAIIFKEKGIAALEKLAAPADWYQAVACFDDFQVDYFKILKLRSGNMDFFSFTINDIRSCLDDSAGNLTG